MPDHDFKNKVIVITGASSGFGKGEARQFAAQGATVILAARRKQLLDELARECEAAGGRAIAVTTDVSREADVEALAKTAIEHFGRIDVWINNAGTGAIGRFEDIPIEVHRKVIETDLLGTIYGSHAALRQFHRQGAGILINIASVVGKVPGPYYASYVAAKFGVVGLSASIRQELEAYKIDTIRVCTVLPAAYDTPFFDHVANYSGHEFQTSTPVYEPKEVVDTVVNLVSEPKDEVSVGAITAFAIFAHRILPGLLESKLAKDGKEFLEKAPPQQETGGSLIEPAATGTDVVAGRRKSH